MRATRSHRSRGRRIANGLLWVGAGLGVLSLLAAAAVALFGLVPLVFTSGSMAPEAPTGSLGIAHSVPASDLAVGDVVSVASTEGNRVTHRIVSIETNEGDDTSVLTLKGDANERPDKDPYVVAEADRLLFSVPWAGYLLSALATPIALFLGGILAAAVVFWVATSARRGRAAPDRGGARRAHTARCVAAGVIAVSVPGLLGLAPAQTTTAAFNDLGGTVTTSGFVAHRVAPPSGIDCQATGLLGLPTNLEISTPVTDSRYTYWVRIFDASGTAITPYRQMAGTGATRQYTYALLSGDLPLLGVGTTYYARVFARVNGTSWESADYRSFPVSKTTVLVACGTADPPPVVTFTRPTHLYSGSTTAAHSFITAECDGGYGSTYGAACGTVTDNGSVASVEYILQRTGGTLGVRCWNGGSLWVTNCGYRAAGRTGNRWVVPRNFGAFPYISNGTFTLTIRATDNLGNVTVNSINYTVNY